MNPELVRHTRLSVFHRDLVLASVVALRNLDDSLNVELTRSDGEVRRDAYVKGLALIDAQVLLISLLVADGVNAGGTADDEPAL